MPLRSDPPEARPMGMLLGAAVGQIEDPASPNWEPAVQALLEGRYQPLARLVAPIARALGRVGVSPRLAATTRARLRQAHEGALVADLRRERFLRRVLLPALRDRADVILLKGAAFAGRLYDPDEPRGAVDVDLLVREAHFEPAVRAVEAIGGVLHVDPARPRAHLGYREWHFDFGAGSVAVEVHGALADRGLFPLESADLFARARPWAPAPGARPDDRVRRLGDADAFVHLAVHAWLHARLEPYMLVDAHRLIRRGDLDWGEVEALATRAGARTMLHVLLRTLDAWLPPGLPAGLIQQTRPGPVARLAAEALFPIGSYWAAGPVGIRRRQALALALLDGSLRPMRAGAAFVAGRALDRVPARGGERASS